MKTYLNHIGPRGAMAAVFALSLIFVWGCGSKGSKGATLTGKVMYKDQPLTGGSITLHSADGKGKQYKTAIAPEGTYAIGEITPGQWVVTIETESIRGQTGVSYKAPPGETAPDMGVKLAKYVPIPKSYGNPNSTPLQVKVKRGKNKQDFKLDESGQ